MSIIITFKVTINKMNYKTQKNIIVMMYQNVHTKYLIDSKYFYFMNIGVKKFQIQTNTKKDRSPNFVYRR